MKCFLVFCLVFTTKLFATYSENLRETLFATRGSAAQSVSSSALSKSCESWEYVRDSYQNKLGIIATRTNVRGSRRFFIDVLQCLTCEDFFSAPEYPCDRHLVGSFTLINIPTYAECSASGAENMQQITNHRMHLRMVWFFDSKRNLVSGPLEKLKYDM